jgi:hypothetical protein
MIKKYAAKIIIVVLLLLSSNSCTLNENIDDTYIEPAKKYVQFKLDCFPDYFHSYTILIEFYKKSGETYTYIDKVVTDRIKSIDNLYNSYEISESANYVAVYLFDGIYDYPVYFIERSIDSKNKVIINWWIGYRLYKSDNIVAYGYSTKHLYNFELGVNTTLRFDWEPYYVLKVDNAKGKSYKITVKQYGDIYNLNFAKGLDEYVNNAGDTIFIDSSIKEIYRNKWDGDSMYIMVQTTDWKYSGSCEIKVEEI